VEKKGGKKEPLIGIVGPVRGNSCCGASSPLIDLQKALYEGKRHALGGGEWEGREEREGGDPNQKTQKTK